MGRTTYGTQGPAGPTGPAGADGDDGATGPEGPPGTTDHGALTGLGDDDHPQYVLKTLIDAAGDLIVGTAADTAGRLAKGAALQVLRTNAGATALEWADPAGGGGLSNFRPTMMDYVTGRYYGQEVVQATLTAAAVSANVLYAFPFYCGQAKTFDRIGLRITTGAGSSNVRFGIYESLSTGLPGALLTGALAQQATTGSGVDVENTISQPLSAHTLYWLAAVFSHGPSVQMLPKEMLGTIAGSTALNALAAVFLGKAFTYAALPDPWGVSPDYYSAQNAPNIRLRAA